MYLIKQLINKIYKINFNFTPCSVSVHLAVHIRQFDQYSAAYVKFAIQCNGTCKFISMNSITCRYVEM